MAPVEAEARLQGRDKQIDNVLPVLQKTLVPNTDRDMQICFLDVYGSQENTPDGERSHHRMNRIHFEFLYHQIFFGEPRGPDVVKPPSSFSTVTGWRVEPLGAGTGISMRPRGAGKVKVA